jgi:MFS family permease
MHFADPLQQPSAPSGKPWWAELTRYHWFVLAVAALGWMFDCLDQQLFNLARVPAMRELVSKDPKVFNEYGGYATSIFLIGWATGGLAFGVLGDRIGRAKTMMLTILIYSLCTGLSAAAQNFWQFAVFRFITGLGVGGEFAVGVALVAEVMPDRARPFALGLLQALSAIGNITAALIGMGMGQLEEAGAIGSSWRWMFIIGALPALLALVIRRRLKEPERWKSISAGHQQQLGSYRELFGNPTWRKHALAGLALAVSGVIGLWGIGFFSLDLNRSVFRKKFEQEYREAGQSTKDLEFVRTLLRKPDEIGIASEKIKPDHLLEARVGDNDLTAIYSAMIRLTAEKRTPTQEAVLGLLDESDTPLEQQQPRPGQSVESRSRRLGMVWLSVVPTSYPNSVAEHIDRISQRTKELNGRLSYWVAVTSMMLNLGAFFGIYMFSHLAHRIGRKPTFAICFVLALVSTAGVFWFLETLAQVFWMIPIMGFCQLSLFGGYAIYFPELFPTRLRSTGTSFCYNVGRFLAAVGPSALGLLSSRVYGGFPEPMRYAGVTMCAVFLIGLIALPFAPETRGKPLPE